MLLEIGDNVVTTKGYKGVITNITNTTNVEGKNNGKKLYIVVNISLLIIG